MHLVDDKCEEQATKERETFASEKRQATVSWSHVVFGR